MDFQSIGRSSNFATAGNAAADDTLKSFLAARRNSPKYGKLAQQAASYKSAEKVATIKAEAKVEQAGIAANAKVKANKIDINAKSEYASAKRKAGAVGLAGKMFGSIANAGGDKPLEPYKGRQSRAELEGEITKFQSEAEEARAGIVELEKPDFSTPGLSTQTSTGGGGGSTNSGGTSTYTPPKPGQIYSKSEMETLAVQGGFDPKDAPLVARIAMGESSGNPTAFNGVGRDQSYGLMQINMLGEMGPERRSQFGISSNEELNDPLTNMKAAHAIYKQQGWGAWGAYTNGSYAKF
jgi:hypothetical protein